MLAFLAAHAAATAANALSPPSPDDVEYSRRLRADGSKHHTPKEAEKKKSQFRRSAQQLHVPPYPTLPPTPPPRPHPPRPPPRPAPSLSSTSTPPRARHSSSSAAAAAAATTAAKNIESTTTSNHDGASDSADSVKSDSSSTYNDAAHTSHNSSSCSSSSSSSSIENATRISELEISRRPLARPAPRSPRMGKSPSSSSDGGFPVSSPLHLNAFPSCGSSCTSSPADSSKSTAADAAATAAAAKSLGLAVEFSSAPTQSSNTAAVPAASSLYTDGETAMPWPEEEAVDTEPAAPQPESPPLPVACQAPSSSTPLLLPLQPPPLKYKDSTTIPANSGECICRSNEEESEEDVKIHSASSDYPLTRNETLELVALLQGASVASKKRTEDDETTTGSTSLIHSNQGSAEDILAVAAVDDDVEVRLRDTCSLPRQPLRWPSEDSALFTTTSFISSKDSTAATNANAEISTAAAATAPAAVLATDSNASKTVTTRADLTSREDSSKEPVVWTEETTFEKVEVSPETSPFLLTLAAALTVAPRHVPLSSSNIHIISGQHDASNEAGEPQISSPALAASTAAAAASTVAAPLSASSSSSSSGQLVSTVVAKEVQTGGNTNEDAAVQKKVEATKSETIRKEKSEILVGNDTQEQPSPLDNASSTATTAEHNNCTNNDDSSSTSSSSCSSDSGSNGSSENARGSARVGSMSSSIPLRWPSEDRAILGSGFTQPSPLSLPSSALPESSETLNATLSMDAPDSDGGELHVDAVNSNIRNQIEEHQVPTRNDTPESSSAAPSPFLSALLHLSGAPLPPSSLPGPSSSGQSANPKSSTVSNAETSGNTPSTESNLLSASSPKVSDEVIEDAESDHPIMSTDDDVLDANNTSSSVSGSSTSNDNSYSSSNKSNTRRNAFASCPNPRLRTLRRLQPAAGVGIGAAPTNISAAVTPAEPATAMLTVVVNASKSLPGSAVVPSAASHDAAVSVATLSSGISMKSGVLADESPVAADDSMGAGTNKRPSNVEVPMPRKGRAQAALASAATATTAPVAAAAAAAPNRGDPATAGQTNAASPITSASPANLSASDAVEPSATSSARPQLPAKPPTSARILRRRAVSAAVAKLGTSASSALPEGVATVGTGTGPGSEVPVAQAPDRAKNDAVIDTPQKVEPAASPVREPRKVLLRKRGGSAVPKAGEGETATTEAKHPPKSTPPRVPCIDHDHSSGSKVKPSDTINSNNSAVSRISTSSSGRNIPRLEERVAPAPISSVTSSPRPSSSSSSSLRSAQPAHVINAAPTAPLLSAAISTEVPKSQAASSFDTVATSSPSSKHAKEVKEDISGASGNAFPGASSVEDSPSPLSSPDSKGLKSTNHGLW